MSDPFSDLMIAIDMGDLVAAQAALDAGADLDAFTRRLEVEMRRSLALP